MGQSKKEKPLSLIDQGFQNIVQHAVQNVFHELLKEGFLVATKPMKKEFSELEKRKYLRGDEVAKIYGISSSTLLSWRKKSCGPKYYTPGRAILYKREDLESYLARHEVLTLEDDRQARPQ